MFTAYYPSSVVVLNYVHKFFAIVSFNRWEFNSFPLECDLDSVTCFQQTEYGESNGMWLPRLGDKRHCRRGKTSLWFPPNPLASITRSGGSHLPCHEDTQVTLWRVHILRNWGLLTTTSKDLRPPANSQLSEPSWKLILQTQLSL